MYQTESSRWQAVQARDRAAASSFVYAVISTRIYCRPACPSRTARRANVCFYDTAHNAEAAGYRPCLRCKPAEATFNPDGQHAQRDVVRKACQYIAEMNGQAKFPEVAKHVGLSTRYLYGLFKTVMGTTPAKYAAGFKLDRTAQTSLETPSDFALSVVSPLVMASAQMTADVLPWGAFADSDFVEFATLPEDAQLAPLYSVACSENSYPAPSIPASTPYFGNLFDFDIFGAV